MPGPRRDDAPGRRTLPVALASIGFLSVLALAGAGAAGLLPSLPRNAPEPTLRAVLLPSPAVPTPPEPAPPEPSPVERFRALTVRLARNQTLAQALYKLQLPAADVNGIVEALTGLFPFNRSRPGDQLRVERREGEASIHRLSVRQGPADEWIVERLDDGSLRASKRPVDLVTAVARVEVTIEGSLWSSLEKAGELPELAVLASDVLAWDVDFYLDVRSGDRLRVLAQKVSVDDRLLRYGEILAVEYDGAATGEKRLFRYTDPSGRSSYYDENGQSARRGFLKSPLKLARITSGFGNRVHPLLGFERAHQGIDYGAPAGTPVWAVGDGTVRQAGVNGDCGKSVTLRHRNGLETVYCHLSSVTVSVGRAVSQKEVIGTVGSTGLATGPHLHFAVRKDGRFVNPLKLEVPRDAPVAPENLDDFREKVAPLRARLEGLPLAVD